MKTHNSIFTCIALSALACNAGSLSGALQPKSNDRTFAVVGMVSNGGGNHVAAAVEQELGSALKTLKGVKLIERSELGKLIDECRLSDAGILESTSAIEKFQVKGVNYLVYGVVTFADTDSTYYTNSKGRREFTGYVTRIHSTIRMTDSSNGNIAMQVSLKAEGRGSSESIAYTSAIQDLSKKFRGEVSKIITENLEVGRLVDVLLEEKQVVIRVSGQHKDDILILQTMTERKIAGETFLTPTEWGRVKVIEVVAKGKDELCLCRVLKKEKVGPVDTGKWVFDGNVKRLAELSQLLKSGKIIEAKQTN